MRRTQAFATAGLGILAVTLTGCVYTENVGLVLDSSAATCFMQTPGTAVLQLPLTADPTVGFDPDLLRVELDEPANIALSGIGLVAGEAPFTEDAPVPAAVLETLVESRDDTMLHAEVDHGEIQTLVVLFETGQADAPGQLESLRVFWGGREPVYWQPLDLAVTVDDACTLG